MGNSQALRLQLEPQREKRKRPAALQGGELTFGRGEERRTHSCLKQMFLHFLSSVCAAEVSVVPFPRGKCARERERQVDDVERASLGELASAARCKSRDPSRSGAPKRKMGIERKVPSSLFTPLSCRRKAFGRIEREASNLRICRRGGGAGFA